MTPRIDIVNRAFAASFADLPGLAVEGATDSQHWQSVQMVLEVRAAIAATQAAEATVQLVNATRLLAILTGVMAGATLALAVASFVG